MPDASYWRATYSLQARNAAGEAAHNAYAEFVRSVRQAEQIPGWVKPFMDKNDKMGERLSDFSKVLLDASQVYWGRWRG